MQFHSFWSSIFKYLITIISSTESSSELALKIHDKLRNEKPFEEE